MPDTTADLENRASWNVALVGMLLFLVDGAGFLAMYINPVRGLPTLIFHTAYRMFWVMICLSPLGAGVGLVKGFPRWSYPYVFQAVMMGLYMMNEFTPGPFGLRSGDEPWGWWAWAPLLAATLVGLAVARSFRPLWKFFTNVWNDWTLVTFGMLGWVPIIIVEGYLKRANEFQFEKSHHYFLLVIVMVLTSLMCGTALAYLRSQTRWQQIFSLAMGVVLIFGIAMSAPTRLGNGWNIASLEVLRAITIVLCIMFSPVLIGLLRHTTRYLPAGLTNCLASHRANGD